MKIEEVAFAAPPSSTERIILVAPVVTTPKKLAGSAAVCAPALIPDPEIATWPALAKAPAVTGRFTCHVPVPVELVKLVQVIVAVK